METPIKVPELLNIPPKLFPVIEQFNTHRFFVLEGGRGSGKTHSVARILTYLSSIQYVRIVCGREIQNKIDESVKSVFVDLINNFNLDFTIKKDVIIHNKTGSTINFRGFRDTGGKPNVRGMEKVDILWVDEAQSLSKSTVEEITPTINRNPNSKIIMTMNRLMRDDPAYVSYVGSEDCLHIHIDYLDNPFCTADTIKDANRQLELDEKRYNHIWLGQPLARSDDYLFNVDKLDAAMKLQAFGDLYKPQCVIGVDVAGKGGDLCVASILRRASDLHWELETQEAWSEPDTMVSIGRIVSFVGKYKPNAIVVDVGGLGWPMFNRMQEIGLNCLFAFDGAASSKEPNAINRRAEAYLLLREWFDNQWLICRSKETIEELEHIKMIANSNGYIKIQSKKDIKDEGYHSPDRADSLMMAVYGARHFLTNLNKYNGLNTSNLVITRKTGRRQLR